MSTAAPKRITGNSQVVLSELKGVPGFMACIKDLQKKTGASLPVVMKSEIASVCKIALSRSRKPAKPNEMKKEGRLELGRNMGVTRYGENPKRTKAGMNPVALVNPWAGAAGATRKNRSAKLSLTGASQLSRNTPGKVTINLGVKSGAPVGRLWHRSDTPKPGSTSNNRLVFANVNSSKSLETAANTRGVKYHFSNAQWQHVVSVKRTWEQQVKNYEKIHVLSSGFSRKSWIDMCGSVGITPAMMKAVSPQSVSIDKYLKTRASNGRDYVNGTGAYTDKTMPIIGTYNHGFILVNKFPRIIKIGGKKALASAITTRKQAFSWAMRKGVFNDVKAVRSRYPLLFNTTN